MSKLTRRSVRALPLILILAAAAFGALALRDTLSFETLQQHNDALKRFTGTHYALSAGLFVLAYVAVVALSLPGATLCTLTGGYLFGLFPGVVFNVAAATAGATLIFLAARLGAGARIAARLDGATGPLARMRDGLRDGEISYLLALRLIPVFPFFLVNLLPAFLGVSTFRFVATTLFGIIPATFVFTSAGSGLEAVLAADRKPDVGLLLRPAILGPLLGLATLTLLPVIWRRWRRRE